MDPIIRYLGLGVDAMLYYIVIHETILSCTTKLYQHFRLAFCGVWKTWLLRRCLGQQAKTRSLELWGVDH